MNTIATLRIKPGIVCWAAYCALDKPHLEYRDMCRTDIEHMVIKRQKAGYDAMVKEAADIIIAYTTF